MYPIKYIYFIVGIFNLAHNIESFLYYESLILISKDLLIINNDGIYIYNTSFIKPKLKNIIINFEEKL